MQSPTKLGQKSAAFCHFRKVQIAGHKDNHRTIKKKVVIDLDGKVFAF
jgi:hypothetical protein